MSQVNFASSLKPESNRNIRKGHGLFSVVVPCFNEESTVSSLFERLSSVLLNLGVEWEIILVDDGSTDQTYEAAKTCRNKDSRVKVIRLSRNFGKEIALTAGLDHCSGDAVITMDGDLEEPPEVINLMLEKWEQGADIVYGYRTSRVHDTFFRRLASKAFYGIFNAISEINLSGGGDFHLFDRSVVLSLTRMREKSRFMKGLYAWAGYKPVRVYFERGERVSGKSKWSFWKLWKLSLNFLTGYSAFPVKVWSYFGGLVSLFAFFYGSFILLRTLVFGTEVEGYPSILLSILFLGGVQLISLGLIGEYLSRVYDEVKGRPMYVVKNLDGLDNFSNPKN